MGSPRCTAVYFNALFGGLYRFSSSTYLGKREMTQEQCRCARVIRQSVITRKELWCDEWKCGGCGSIFVKAEDLCLSATNGAKEKVKEKLETMLEDVVNELDLSELAIEKHGQLGTAPADLVKLVLQEKDREISMLRRKFKGHRI